MSTSPLPKGLSVAGDGDLYAIIMRPRDAESLQNAGSHVSPERFCLFTQIETLPHSTYCFYALHTCINPLPSLYSSGPMKSHDRS